MSELPAPSRNPLIKLACLGVGLAPCVLIVVGTSAKWPDEPMQLVAFVLNPVVCLMASYGLLTPSRRDMLLTVLFTILLSIVLAVLNLVVGISIGCSMG
ncbi:MAG: hypothetical protein RLY20_700 [Verrucomicrobiota bacterium]|jgi:hypothetical protein